MNQKSFTGQLSGRRPFQEADAKRVARLRDERLCERGGNGCPKPHAE
jgi:hypothetical protein